MPLLNKTGEWIRPLAAGAIASSGMLAQQSWKAAAAAASVLVRFDAGLRRPLSERFGESVPLYCMLQILLYIVIPIGSLFLIGIKIAATLRH